MTTLNAKSVGKYEALVCIFIQPICILLFNGGEFSSILLLFVYVSFLFTIRYLPLILFLIWVVQFY